MKLKCRGDAFHASQDSSTANTSLHFGPREPILLRILDVYSTSISIMASGQPFASRSYAGTKLPDRSANANAMPFSATSFSRHRGLGASAPEFNAEGPKQNQQPAPAQQSHAPAQDANPLSRLTEEQREEINEAVRISSPCFMFKISLLGATPCKRKLPCLGQTCYQRNQKN